MHNKYKIKQHTKVHLQQLETKGSHHFFSNEKEAKHILEEDITKIQKLQQKLYAGKEKALLIIFQGIDTAGKDSCIKHIFSGVNPQGCTVTSFKQPSTTELEHDFMWRHYTALPAKGYISIFNRSYYENMLVTRVHPDLLLKEKLQGIVKSSDAGNEFWQQRCIIINNFEQQLAESGTTILKFFLHISKHEQKNRLLQRIQEKDKNWKFEYGDLAERKLWKHYQQSYEDVLSHTSSHYAHWYVIPADEKWFSRVVISRIVAHVLGKMSLQFPEVTQLQKEQLLQAEEELTNEN
ncbi:MAG: PPK2 family polyphosphate kinase [Bacteroidota bacterium]